MRVSNVRVRLTEKDIFSIINQYLKVEGLNINNIKIGELIEIKGSYESLIKINFNIKLGIGRIEKNILKLKIINIKLGNIPIWTSIANIILKNILKSFSNMGIKMERGTIFIDFYKLCKYIPSVEFVLGFITLLNGGVEVEVEDLTYDEEKEILSLSELKNKIEDKHKEEKFSNCEEENFNKEKDLNNKKKCNNKNENNKYRTVRNKFTHNIPQKYENIGNIAMFIPDIIDLLYKLLKDSRVNTKTKVLIGSAIGYLIIPIDLIPDNIPIIGKLDDIGIGFLILDKIIDSINDNIILEHWQGKQDVIFKVKEVKENMFNTLGRKNSIKILSSAIIMLKSQKKSKTTKE